VKAECLLKIKLIFAVVFLINFAFIIQHSDVDHKAYQKENGMYFCELSVVI